MRPGPGARGYRLHVDLTQNLEWLPKVGRNSVRVDVLEKDQKLVDPIRFHDVELIIEYLPHRHGVRLEEQYSGGAMFTP